MTFDFPLLLALTPVLGILAGFIAWRSRKRRIVQADAWSASAGKKARSYGRGAPVVIGGATLVAAVALAGPRGGRTEVTTHTRALNVVLAVDISRSMLAEDARPNRLQHAAREARRLVQDLDNDRVGLIAFAGRSYILSPLTVDAGAVNLFLDALDPDLASEGGTSIGAMLSQAQGLLQAPEEGADRVLVVFSDGETLDSMPETLLAAKELGAAGIRLVLVAEGGAQPVRIPIRDTAGTLVEYKLDENGTPVETARRDDRLQAIADAAEGVVVSAELPDQAGAVLDLLDSFKRVPTASTRSADLIPLGWIPLLLAALILLLHTLSRRHAALVAIAGLMLGSSRAQAQQPTSGDRALGAGRISEAATRYLRDAGRGGGTDTAWYNAGTAALAAGNLDVARRALSRAAASADPDIRYRALYNLGVASLLAARQVPDSEAMLNEAETAFRQALLLQPSSLRAKWNLELTLRRKPPESGGGGTPPPPPPGSGAAQQEPDPDRSPGGISRSQADQILNSVDREERETRLKHVRRDRSEPMPGGVKDW